MLSHRSKLALSYVLVVLIGVFAASAYITRTMNMQLRASLDRELANYARMCASAIEVLPAGLSSLTELEEMVKEFAEDTDLRITIISADGRVLADSVFAAGQLEGHASRPEIVGASSRGIAYATRYSASAGQDWRYVALRIVDAHDGVLTGFVRVADSLDDVDQMIGSTLSWVLRGSALALVIGLLLSTAISRYVGAPLKDMAQAALALASGDFSQRLPMRSRDEVGQLAEAFNTMSTRLHRAMNELASGKDRLAAVLAGMTDGVVAVGADTRLILINHAAMSMMRLSSDEGELVGKPLAEVVRNIDLNDALRQALRGTPCKVDMVLGAGVRREVQISASPFPSGDGAVAVLSDMTEIRRLEAVRRDFVSNVSHELRTPVTSIRGFVDTLLDGAMHDQPTLERFLKIISRDTARLSAITSGLLALARIESGEANLSLTPASMAECAEAAIEAVQPCADRCSVRLVNQIEEAVVVMADKSLIVQVIVNLLDNAVKYSTAGSDVIVGATAADHGMVRVWVADKGQGIAREHLSRVFERFYRVDKGRSRQEGGTGLGLSIVKHIVERHGGQVGVESVLGHGSTFWFTLLTQD